MIKRIVNYCLKRDLELWLVMMWAMLVISVPIVIGFAVSHRPKRVFVDQQPIYIVRGCHYVGFGHATVHMANCPNHDSAGVRP